ncbi:SAM-dependent DNA methyltransferase [Lysobacter soli]|uniref:site-specific DNA-methyltransferase (adenine-specific) n=1 Tax=Lysobacter soli TaxID=453783 RepID=A0A3D8VFW6_9GAMM|nr:N-6 DNA methylase [Lysobacter soli]RDY67718.1 SAM-dependent DNA methyltransferase [Lysobacter soli]
MNFIANETAQKLRGGYYTPEDLATFLCQWVLEIDPKRVLEPSCGDGVFFSALRGAGAPSTLEVTAMELNDQEAAKSRRRAKEVGLPAAKVHVTDFLSWALEMSGREEATFDAVIGNPPFVRYQYLPEPFQVKAEQVFRSLGLPFTKHTNAWVPFILASMKMLRPGGRLAMVVPAEIIHVMHAQSLRSYLGAECRRLVVIDPEELWFAGTLQGAVLLLAEKRRDEADKAQGLGIYEVRDREFLRMKPAKVFSAPQSINGKTVAGKWTRAILDKETRDLFDELGDHEEVHRFSDVADVNVGIVTGANKFFLVTDEVVAKHGLERWAYPMFGRSEHCPGVIYDTKQHAANAKVGNPTNFLWFQDSEPLRYKKSKAYIEAGEAESLHTRYKCRIRSPWFSVPSVYSTEIGMLKRSHDLPRLILNKAGAYTTDTAYRIRVLNGTSAEKFVACFFNGLTALSAELEGRYYGGGVLELVPSEIEKLVIPLPGKIKAGAKELDKQIRTQTAREALEVNSRIVLGGLGLSHAKQGCVLNGWKRLRDRRHRTTSDEKVEVEAV